MFDVLDLEWWLQHDMQLLQCHRMSSPQASLPHRISAVTHGVVGDDANKSSLFI